MSLDPEIRKLMHHVVHVAPPLAATETGDRQYGDPEPRQVYQQSRSTVVASPDGTELLSDISWISEQPVGLQDRCWLAGQDPYDSRRARMPKSAAPITDEDGSISHYEVSL